MTKLLFLATDTFPTPTLKALYDSKDFEVGGLVTSPTIKNYKVNSVEQKAQELNISIFAPQDINKEFKEIIDRTEAELLLVCNYGRILSEELINYPEFNTLNIHASLLPKLRGACPIQMAILRDFKITGVTIQKVVKELDKGDILTKKEIDITKEETGRSLRDKLSKLSAKITPNTLKNHIEGETVLTPQNDQEASYCYIEDISKEKAKIDWEQKAQVIERKIRAFNPRPTAWSFIKVDDANKRLKIFSSELLENKHKLQPGQVKIDNNKLIVGCLKSALNIKELQLEGKKRMSDKQFILGLKDEIKLL